MNFLALTFSAHGRITRATWLGRLLLAGVLAAAFGLLFSRLAGDAGAALVALLFVWSACALAAQRLHDAGKSAWTLLLFLLPVLGPVVLLVQLLGKSAEGPNRYGMHPSSRANYLTVDISS